MHPHAVLFEHAKTLGAMVPTVLYVCRGFAAVLISYLACTSFVTIKMPGYLH